MTDELVQRHVEQLRLTGGDLADLCQPLADAIEALTAERDEALECNEEFFVDNQFLKKRVEETRKEWEGWQSASVKLMKQVTALTAERDRLREALGAFVAHYPKGINPDLDAACFAARAALKGETP